MWLVVGLLAGAGVAIVLLWLRSRSVRTSWYHWLIAMVGLLLIFFALENARTSISEFENTAAARSVLIFGLPGIVLVALSGLLVWFRASRRARHSG
jgi:uncharacterized membrane protein